MSISVEFSGGLETLFDDRRQLTVELPTEESTIVWLLGYLAKQMSGRQDLFLQDGLVRPGILVLINDTDWELVGEEEYVLQSRDNILFASTLHGG